MTAGSMSTQVATADCIQHIEASAFPGFVADLWRRLGWTVDDGTDWDDTFLATRPDGTALVLRALTHVDGHVSPAAIHELARARTRHGTDRATVVSPIGFTPSSTSVADAYGVDALGPDALARVVAVEDAPDLVPRR
jgi:hypothetical protein